MGCSNPTPVHFWSHDFDVEPGATYRYRARLVFVNPMYGRKSSLDESLHEFADAKLSRSEWSGWGEPVDVSWDEYYFLTGASAGNSAIGSASATAELYRFYYGYWRKSTVALQPGDRFVSQIELPAGLQRWDVQRPAAAQAWKPDAGEAEEAAVKQPKGVEELLLPPTLAVAADSWMLDAVESPMATAGIGGLAEVPLEILVRGPDGQIASRSPRIDQNTPLYAVIKASAELGQDQLPRVPTGQQDPLSRGSGGDGRGGDGRGLGGDGGGGG